jgi:hypothetical protein
LFFRQILLKPLRAFLGVRGPCRISSVNRAGLLLAPKPFAFAYRNDLTPCHAPIIQQSAAPKKSDYAQLWRPVLFIAGVSGRFFLSVGQVGLQPHPEDREDVPSRPGLRRTMSGSTRRSGPRRVFMNSTRSRGKKP